MYLLRIVSQRSDAVCRPADSDSHSFFQKRLGTLCRPMINTQSCNSSREDPTCARKQEQKANVTVPICIYIYTYIYIYIHTNIHTYIHVLMHIHIHIHIHIYIRQGWARSDLSKWLRPDHRGSYMNPRSGVTRNRSWA